MNPNTTCLSCNKPLRGRTDKKFCNDYCRNMFHNKEKSARPYIINKVNRILLRNHQILQNLIEAGGIFCTRREYLMEMGFSFRYITHIKKGRGDTVYRFCYAYGYLEGEKGEVLLIGEEELIY